MKNQTIHTIAFQFKNGVVYEFTNYPSIALMIGGIAEKLGFWGVIVNGQTIDCSTIAKVFIDGRGKTFPDPFFDVRMNNTGEKRKREIFHWRKNLGKAAFDFISKYTDQEESAFNYFVKTEFPSQRAIDKAQRAMAMKVAKALYEESEEAKEEKSTKEPTKFTDDGW